MQEATFAQPTFPELYERFLVQPLFRPWADDVFDRVHLARGDRVLDVACGTGILARVAKERLEGSGRVVGVDVNAQMLAVARTTAPDIEWREGNAVALPIEPGERFDVVVCQQGLQFFPDKAASVGEMRRALDGEGRVAVATWRPLDEIPFFTALHRIAERHLGPIEDRRHSFGETTALQRLLEQAGFDDVRVETVSRTLRFEDPTMVYRLNAQALVGMSRGHEQMSADERARWVDLIAAESAEVHPSFSDGAGIAFEMRTNVATAWA